MTNSRIPCTEYIFMMCHRMGRPPISIIGLGRMVVSSDRRVPRPPARITAFIVCPAYNRPQPRACEAAERPLPLRPFSHTFDVFSIVSRRPRMRVRCTTHQMCLGALQCSVLGEVSRALRSETILREGISRRQAVGSHSRQKAGIR